jgi:hypothetical protein
MNNKRKMKKKNKVTQVISQKKKKIKEFEENNIK